MMHPAKKNLVDCVHQEWTPEMHQEWTVTMHQIKLCFKGCFSHRFETSEKSPLYSKNG